MTGGAQPVGPDAGDPGAALGALADPTRRELLEHLARHGPRSATELAPAYVMTRQAVVKHLAALSAAGLVEGRREGRDVRYYVVPGRLDGAASWLTTVGRRWDERLDGLRRHLAAEAEHP